MQYFSQRIFLLYILYIMVDGFTKMFSLL